MSYRLIFRVPEGLTLDMLTETQRAAILSVFGQFVLPMPGTIPAEGKVICDGVSGDNFDAGTLGPLGLPFDLLGQWPDDGGVIVPLDADTFIKHLPAVQSYDAEGNPVGEPVPPVLHEPHRWAGWPELF